MVPLGEVLAERRETPAMDDLVSGRIRIIEKIGFDDGCIQLRANGTTKTGMILIRPGDLVVSGINVAKGAIAIYDPEANGPIAATIHYGVYAPNTERADVRFLWWLLRSRFFQDLLREYVPGGIKTELKARRLLPVPVPLPPLSEQRRIVARIEELAAQIEGARRLRREAVEEVEGLVSRATSRFLDEVGWEREPLGEILAESPRNGLSPKLEVDSGGRPMLRINAVSSSPTRYIDLTAAKSIAASDAEAAPFVLQNDDVFIVRYNGDINRVAKPAIFKSAEPCNVVFPDKLMRLRPDRSRMLPDFLVFALSSRSVREQVENLGKTTAGNIGVSGRNAISFVVPVPPLSEQHRIVAELDALQAEVDRLKALQAETASELGVLLPSILDRVFKGEL